MRAAEQPAKPAYVFLEDGEREGARLSYGDLDRRARAIALHLRTLGVGGERALLLYPPGLAYIEAFFGCLYAGVVAVPAYPPSGRHLRRLQSIAKDAAPIAVLSIASMRDRFELEARDRLASRPLPWIATDEIDSEEADAFLRSAPAADQLAFLQYTSGSTGDPKGVMVSHGNLSSNQLLIAESFAHDGDSDLVGWLPLYHDMGLIGNILQPLFVGATAYLMSPTAFLEKPLRWLKAISAYKARTSGGPNFAFDLCVSKIKEEDKRELDLTGWRIAFTGAEPVRAATLDRFAASFASCGFRRESFFPCYGLAEATLVVTAPTYGERISSIDIDRDASEARRVASTRNGRATRLIGCGHAWEGHDVQIVDPDTSRRCSRGEIGEIWTAGPGVAQGYWNRPEETARVFEAKIAGGDGRPYLRTGDLGFADEGQTYVTGRLKDLVIVAGRNFHPEDIENAVEEKSSGLRRGATAAFAVTIEDKEQLVIVAEPDRALSTTIGSGRERDVLRRIRDCVVYDIGIEPADIVLAQSGSVPKTSSGKIRRSECRRNYLADELKTLARLNHTAPVGRDSVSASGAGDAPHVAAFLRQAVACLDHAKKSELLTRFVISNIARLLKGSEREFTAATRMSRAGLSSLRAVELKHALDTALGVETPIAIFLSDLTIAEAADSIARSLDDAALASDVPPVGAPEPFAPMSFSQRAIWTVHQIDAASEAYNLHLALAIDGELDFERLRTAVSQLMEAHAQLRTIYRADGSGQETVPLAALGEWLRREDAAAWSANELNAALAREARRRFDLEKDAPLRIVSFDRGATGSILFFAAHHIAVDLWSLLIFVSQLDAAYRTPERHVAHGAYSDVLRREARYLDSPSFESDWAYWAEQLTIPLPTLALPTDFRRSSTPDHRGASAPIRLDSELFRKLKALAKQEGTSLFSLLLAAYFVLLHRLSGQTDIIVGAPTSGRLDSETESLIGNCVNPIALRAQIRGDDRFRDVLVETQARVRGALEHQRFPFPLIVERIKPERHGDRWPIYQSWFVLQEAQSGAPSDLAALALGEDGAAFSFCGRSAKSLRLPERAEIFDLKVMAAEIGQELLVSFQYETRLFVSDTIERFARYYVRLLEDIVSRPEQRVDGLAMLGDAERRRLLVDWNETTTPYSSDKLIHEMFEEQAAKSPDAVAVEFEDRYLSYAELDAEADRLARLLGRRGVGADAIVGICLERSVEMVVSLLAVLKAGGAYLPLDPDHPPERLGYMIGDASPRLVITTDRLSARLPSEIDLLKLDHDEGVIAAETSDPSSARADADNLAYVIYTSGSTGRPKGVGAPHRGVVNRLSWMQAHFELTSEDSVLQKTRFGFDVSVWEFFWPLLVGARVTLAGPDDHLDPARLAELIRQKRVTTLHFVPTMLQAFLNVVDMSTLPSLRRVICSGEELPSAAVRRFFAASRAELHNLYGPTEVSIDVSAFACLRSEESDVVPIGRPIANIQLYLLDANLEPVPRGVAAELFIGGVGLARGYLGKPHLTAERFVPNPFSASGERLYRTGDLARYRRDGEIEFLGRIDRQVKIRGFRIELGEVESALSRILRGGESVVLARTDASGSRRLVAYVVTTGGLDAAALDAALRRELPDYMIPTQFVRLDAMPLTPNGKIDRKALPAPDPDDARRRPYVPPRTTVEKLVCEIFADVLDIEKIGRDDGFFELGGDSIRAIQVTSRLRQAGYELTPRHLFQSPSAALLASQLNALPSGLSSVPEVERALLEFARPFSLAELESEEIERIRRRLGDVEDIYPLTPMQEGMLFHALSHKGAGLYHMQERYEINGPFDIDDFVSAWRAVVARHSNLRTSFISETGGRAHQIVHRQASLPVDVVDLRALASDEQTARIDEMLRRERAEGFDLAQAPLMRIKIIRVADDRHIFVRCFHHIIMDDWCTSPLMLDMREHYAAARRGTPATAAPARQFRDYIAWLRTRSADAAESFWRSYLDGFSEPTPLVGAKAAAGDAAVAVDDVIVELSAERYGRLEELARQNMLTVNTYVQGAVALLLARVGGVDEVVFGVTVAGRPTDLPGAESTLGLFINSLPLRVRIRPEERVVDWLRSLLSDNLEMRQHEFVSQSAIQSWSAIPRSDSLLFQHLLTFENAPVDPTLRKDKDILDIDLQQLRVHTNYPLTFVAIPGKSLTLRLTYDRDVFGRPVIESMAARLKRGLEELIEKTGGHVGEVDLLDEAERARIGSFWSGRVWDYGEPVDVASRFEAQARMSGEAIAASCGDARLSYRALDERADRLAHALVASGVGPDAVVALLDERGLDFLVAVLAVFKAGGAYLPLDPAHPDGRVAAVLEESRAGLLLAGSALRERAETIVIGLAEPRPEVLDMAALEAGEKRVGAPPRRHAPDNLAFVIYTSGSTGKPKGAMVEHRGMFNNLVTKIPALGLASGDVIAQTASQCFDISVWQFLTALTIGARVEIFPDAVSRDPQRLAEEIEARGVTILEAVPSMIRALLDISETGTPLRGLRWLLPCGEAFSPELCRRFMERYPQVRLLNAYGPAECSDDVTYHPIESPPQGDDLSVPIGRPVDNTRIYLLDRRLEPTPIGAPGEICVGGVQVGRGYLQRPDLTAASFAPDPFGPAGTRLYRTGDLGRYRPDGVIEFLGRVDHQVKIRGHRIEPGEVEARLSAHPLVRAASVVARPAGPGLYRLVAYLVGRLGDVDADELRRHLRQTLPDYMIPSAFVPLDALPLTPNGKVDRKALPEPDLAHLARRFVAPRNQTENILAKIWADVLRLPDVGVHDNFFELGGDSILSIQIVSRARQAGVMLMPKQLFDLQTIAELAAATEPLRIVAEEGVVEGEAPLTPIQRWFFEQNPVNAAHWNLAVLLQVRAALDAAAMAAVVRRLVDHHDALRARFLRRDGEWTFVNAAAETREIFHREDLSDIASERMEQALADAAQHWQQSLDLENGPLLRVVWIDLGRGLSPRLLIVVHHLVADGVSLRILLEDLDTACRRVRNGEPIVLPAKTTSYRAWALRLRDAAQRAPEADLAHWAKLAVAATSAPSLNAERPDGSNARTFFQEITVSLSRERTRALLQDVSGAYRTRINDVLLAALAKAISRSIGSTAVLVDVEGHGREDILPGVDLARTVGWFTSIYPVLLQLADQDDPGVLLKSVKEQLRAVPSNGFWYGPSRYLANDAGPAIEAPILFNYLGQLDQALPLDSAFAPATESAGVSLSPSSRSRHEWEIIGDVTDARLRLHWRFSGERYSPETMRTLAEDCRRELETLVDHCRLGSGGTTPSDFPLASLEQDDIDRLVDDPRNVEDIYPLSPMQQGLLLHTLLDPRSGVYLMQDVIDLEGDLDPDAFRHAWRQVVDAHSILRTAFFWTTDKQPHQIVYKAVDMPCEVMDWRDCDEEDRRRRLQTMLEAELAEGLGLDRAPILRMRLIRIGESRWIYARSHHHIMLDAWCLPLLLADFLHYYEARLAGAAAPTRVATPYSAYIGWLQRQDFAAAEVYWRKVLKGFETPTYLAAHRSPRALAPGEVEVSDALAELSAPDTVALQEACRKHRLTPSAFLQGAWALLMSHYLNRREILFGVTVAGRPAELPRVEEMAGLFINTLPFRTIVDPSAPLLEWLQGLLSQTAEMRQYEYAALADIQKWSEIERGQQLFDSFVVFENVPVHPTLQREQLPLRILNYSSRTHSNYPINLSIMPHDSLQLKLTYDRRLMDAATAELMLGHYRNLLEGMIRHSEARIGDITLLDEAERARIGSFWSGRVWDDGEPVDVASRFEAQARMSGEAIAASCGDARLSYRALDERADRLAHALVASGVGPDAVVALLDERGLDFLVAVLAVFKAGGAYLPLDPAHPDGRVAAVLEESRAGLLLAGSALRERAETIVIGLAEPRPEVLDMAALEAGEKRVGAPPRRHAPDNLAFVIYTSGSTGKPKGAMVEHRGMFNNLVTKIPALGLASGDVIAQTASQCFDISVWQFLTALTIGARVEIFPDAVSRDPQRLAEEIEARGVTILEAVPSMIRALLDISETGTPLRGLRWLLPCGEAFSPELCRRFMERYPQVRLLNAYGPAECSDDVTYHPIESPPQGDDLSVPIGRPVDNTRIYLLDRRLEPTPIGAPGEICVGGVQVGRGYLQRPDLTAASFAPDPFGPAGTRLYRTGDLGRYRPDGVIEFLGRVDHQVKIRGHRIEPGEVEARLSAHPLVRAASVVARPAGPGLYRLVAYLVGRLGDVDADELRRHLRQTLPDYMIPSAFVPLDALPLTPNGKVDRKALPEPDLAHLARRFVAPRNQTENILAKIWADVLRLPDVGVHDNFFELGGHSLLATRIASRIRTAFEMEIPLRALFEAQTIAEMAEMVNASRVLRDETEDDAAAPQDYEDIEL
ncbi:non-ribosomal peptide synthetase [Methylosinus sp. C49]|nr:non-ribosomal peptide synthetase [Methylosinus sp. C49]